MKGKTLSKIKQNNRPHKDKTTPHGATPPATPKGDKKGHATPRTKTRATPNAKGRATPSPSPAHIVEQVLSVLQDNKAEQITTLDLRGKASFTDYMIIASGRSKRHINAVADYLHRALKNSGIKNIHIEGLPNCDWVLVDAGDVLIHIFRPEVRDFYKIEKMWQADIMDTQSPSNQLQLNNE
ncbi:MAG: ribosome silencing factor [Alphaproteobacteria bacterium]|nr:ribosome silencing factor [Alphaproteobacteria bacterium]